MRRAIEGVIPIGTPWGGPESRRYLSAFVSMLMHIERSEGTDKELHAAHERLYCLYLTVSGIGASTVWSEGLAPCSHEQRVDRLFDDYVERTMAYAGYRYSELSSAAIRADGGPPGSGSRGPSTWACPFWRAPMPPSGAS